MSRASGLPAHVDPELWILTYKHPSHREYLVGNSHTFPGRMSAYCPEENRGFSVSKFEIERCSAYSRRWIDGFLHGNTPPAPDDDDVTPREWESRFARWRELAATFHETGQWPPSSGDE